ncbi:MAG TPA: energy-coupling factor transporter ATPase [Clostridiales bacterium]|nr:MAG: Energy-coupling factor transporter ATP-binding protein EcfA1 [Firmicutes bacterium ADurb.Bin262]HOU36441.1 energy-coupling factor transporter ATPase [Candidatus Omnitrophota bacterium]HQK73807.1 energy-coupling factor transporter ATPase [Clostridiales bacterium]
MQDSILCFQDVSYTYEGAAPGAQPAVRHLNLDVSRGEFVAVIGRNGSGKSTLAKLTNAILVPGSGSVRVNGMDTADEKMLYEIRRYVGMVFQNPDNQIVATIVEDDIAFGPENLGIPPAEIRRRVDEALREVGMYDFRFREPFRLSGGQKQRVAIAGVLAMQTECMVLDEPTAMLDPGGRLEVMKTVSRLNREKGITVVHITHFMEEAAMADRVVVMDKGSIVLTGTPREVFTQVPVIKAAGLDIPQATELAFLLNKNGVDIGCDILTVQEFVEAAAKAAEAAR